ncbi:MAG: hypothetical protein A2X61_01290 [Ignavibacteria bacterium GWB2_35_12]|nr:MAG: hypothetical protein A2X63_13610 [Ignavibacteria bacterium GWA2_35_8]OGU42043.1 MAG: hypothetical protein A2X61_01290 [Ignavibacteria bacterium GWB2_35_12]OGV18716.1 MAG: hypothetical protein A2475_08880 [Ignavibacteria bacterium RIFOXYC2_FULL_35_21]
MKNLIIAIVLYATSVSYSADFKLSDYDLGINNFMAGDRLGNKVAVFCIKKFKESGPFNFSAIRIYEKGKWDSIPTILIINDSIKDIPISTGPQIHFDSTEGIWVGSDMMYCYKNGKWNAFFIDDSLKQWRNYEQFCVDIYNNLWITTSIYDTNKEDGQKYLGNSELLKFDGKSFTTITRTNFCASFRPMSSISASQRSLFALRDGRVVLHRIWYPKDDDFALNDSNSNLIFYNQDGSFTSMQIPSLSGEESKMYIKNVSHIYPEDLNTIWVALNTVSWWDPFTGESGACCSGLVVYKDGNWVIFDESNNLPVYRDSTLILADPTYRIMRLDKSNYLVFAKQMIYSMGNDFILHKANLKAIGDNSLIIRTSSTRPIEYYKTYFRFDDTTSGFHNPIPDIQDVIITNDSVWIITGVGIIVFPKKIVVLNVEETPSTENNSQIYPNPASDFININNQGIYTEYILYNYLGEKLLIGSINSNEFKIDIRSLCNGIYFICLKKNQKQKVIGFIKY